MATTRSSGPLEDVPLLDIPELPEVADSVEAERARRKRELAVTFRVFARNGFDEGIAGHVTARDPGAILRHHGLLTVGRSVAEAAWWFVTMDRACQMQLLAEAAGLPRAMSEEEATLAHRQFSSANLARHNFKVLADLVAEQEPDVLG